SRSGELRTRALDGEAGRDGDVLGGDVVDRGVAEGVERLVDAGAQDVEDVLDAGFSVGGEPPEVRPSDHDGPRAQRERLDDVTAAPDAAVEKHLDPVADGVGDRRQQPDRCRGAVEVHAAVVRDGDRARRDIHVMPGVFAPASRERPIVASMPSRLPSQNIWKKVSGFAWATSSIGLLAKELSPTAVPAAAAARATPTSPSGWMPCAPVGDMITGNEME